MTLNEIDKDISDVIFPWTFDKDVMRWYNDVDPWKVMNWDDFYKAFLLQHSCNAYLLITLRDLELTK